MSEFCIYDRFAGNPVVFEDAELRAVGFGASEDYLIDTGTTFVAVAAGRLFVNGYVIAAGMYACIPAPAVFTGGKCCALLATVKHYRGIFQLGGPIEDAGRLRYINGCTDTGLIQPPRQGDPCLNYLHFPAAIRQDAHHHPSHRVGLICDGQGRCHHDGRVTPMRPRQIFVIPAGVQHWFETADDALRIVTFHPDSEFGPTDENHQMLDATIVGADDAISAR
jgi:quercetin dioxygenase-like cupin family protein